MPTNKGGVVAQSVERATPGEEVPGLIPAVAACSLLVGLVSLLCDWLRQSHGLPALSHVWQQVKMSDALS